MNPLGYQGAPQATPLYDPRIKPVQGKILMKYPDRWLQNSRGTTRNEGGQIYAIDDPNAAEDDKPAAAATPLAPAAAPAPASPGGSAAAQAAAQAAADAAAAAQQTYRANIPKVEMGAIRPGTSWDTLENGRYIAAYEGGSKDNDRNRPIDTSNANFATKAMTEYGARTQDNYGRFVDTLRAEAQNNSAQMRVADEANMARLNPDLALKNPGDQLKSLYNDISNNMKGYLFV